MRANRLIALAMITTVLLGLSARAAENPQPGAFSFEIRGTLPWHNFLSGPTAWNEADYRVYLDNLAAHRLNFVGFHCYTGGAERYAPYVEPMIRFKYRDVLPETGFDTSMTARWGYRPMSVRDFAFGSWKLFRLPGESSVFGANCAITARTDEERYRKAHGLMRKVLAMAHERGIQVSMGFEFGVQPPVLDSVVPPSSRIPGAMVPDPTHPANIEILQGALDDILTEYPGIDWIWLWLHEHSMFVGKPKLSGRFGEIYQQESPKFAEANDEHVSFMGVWSLAYIRQAQEYLAKKSPKTRLVIGGWGGGAQFPPVLRGLDKALPTNIVFSCLNPGMGSGAHAPVLAEVGKHRPVWSIPWLEGDGWLWHLQLRSSSMIDQVKAAKADQMNGVIGIHWRTEEVRSTFEAFAQTVADPTHALTAEEFYRQDCLKQYGAESVAELAPLLSGLDMEKKLGFVSSPEYYPYDPGWGRLSAPLPEKLRGAIELIDRVKPRTVSKTHRANLDWLADNFKFTLLLDEVGRKIEPAYKLKERVLAGEISGTDLIQQAQQARQSLAAAPVEELFHTYMRRVRSRGELGELSALNQKLWLEYRDLEQFLAKMGKNQ